MPLLEEHRQDERSFAQELARLHGPAVQLLDAHAEGSHGSNSVDERLLIRNKFDSEGEYFICLISSDDSVLCKVDDLFAEDGVIEPQSAALKKKVGTFAAKIAHEFDLFDDNLLRHRLDRWQGGKNDGPLTSSFLPDDQDEYFSLEPSFLNAELCKVQKIELSFGHVNTL